MVAMAPTAHTRWTPLTIYTDIRSGRIATDVQPVGACMHAAAASSAGAHNGLTHQKGACCRTLSPWRRRWATSPSIACSSRSCTFQQFRSWAPLLPRREWMLPFQRQGVGRRPARCCPVHASSAAADPPFEVILWRTLHLPRKARTQLPVLHDAVVAKSSRPL